MARRNSSADPLADARVLSRGTCADYFNGKLRSRRRHRVLRVMLTTILAIVLTAGTAVAAYLVNINQQLSEGVDVKLREVLATEEVGDPFYMLLIGIDRDEGRMSDAQYGAKEDAYRSDSIMLLRIDPPRKKVTMVSIHRDTMYDFGEYGVQKINASYTIGADLPMGGAAYTTKTIADFAGVPISHFAQVDMDAMAAVVDAIGGIDVVLDMDCIDPYYTGLDLKAGPQHLDGHTAALFCRARNVGDKPAVAPPGKRNRVGRGFHRELSGRVAVHAVVGGGMLAGGAFGKRRAVVFRKRRRRVAARRVGKARACLRAVNRALRKPVQPEASFVLKKQPLGGR